MMLSENGENSRLVKQQTGVYFLSFILLGLISGLFGPTLPRLATVMGVSLGQAGMIFSARSLGHLFGSFFLGKRYDKYPGHPLLALVGCTIAAMAFLIPVSSIFLLTLGLMFILGMAQGLISVGGNTLIVWVHPATYSSYLIAIHFFFGFGAFLSPLFVAQVAVFTHELIVVFGILAFLSLILALITLRLPSPPIRSKAANEDKVETDKTFLLMTLAFLVIYVGVESNYGAWIYTYALHMNLTDAGGAALVNSAFWLALTIGRLISIPLSRKFYPRHILGVALSGAFISSLMLLLNNGSVVWLWIGVAGSGFFMSTVFPTTFAFAERRIRINGKITGLFFAAASMGAVLVPYTTGMIMEATSPLAVPGMNVLALVLTVLLLSALILYSKKKFSV